MRRSNDRFWIAWRLIWQSATYSSVAALLSYGVRVPRFTADVGVKGGRLAQIGGRMDPGGTDQVLDADGLSVAPGFVDLHMHYDAQIQ